MVRLYADARPEKACLHLDQDDYAAGETVWFGARLVDGQQHRPDSLSQVLHVELVSAQRRVVLRRALHLAGGRAPARWPCPTRWPPAPTPTGCAAPAPTSSIAAACTCGPPPTPGWPTTPPPPAAWGPRPTCSFSPKVAACMAGLAGVVAFKAMDYAGRGLDVAGQVLDAQDYPVATFRSGYQGMGAFRLVPQPGQRYRAAVAQPAGALLVVPPPAARASGYALRVTPEPNAFRMSSRQLGFAHGGAYSA